MSVSPDQTVTTLCYIRNKDTGDILFIVKGREGDPNNGKWLGIGGHVEKNESPDECIVREIGEESGIGRDSLIGLKLRGLITFVSDLYPTEYMHVYEATIESDTAVRESCDEGRLTWVPVDRIKELPVWEGDHIMFDRLFGGSDFFSYKFRYEGDVLAESVRYL